MILYEDVDYPKADLLDLMILGGEELLSNKIIDLYLLVNGHEV